MNELVYVTNVLVDKRRGEDFGFWFELVVYSDNYLEWYFVSKHGRKLEQSGHFETVPANQIGA
jgi:hypothetical protein